MLVDPYTVEKHGRMERIVCQKQLANHRNEHQRQKANRNRNTCSAATLAHSHTCTPTQTCTWSLRQWQSAAEPIRSMAAGICVLQLKRTCIHRDEQEQKPYTQTPAGEKNKAERMSLCPKCIHTDTGLQQEQGRQTQWSGKTNSVLYILLSFLCNYDFSLSSCI